MSEVDGRLKPNKALFLSLIIAFSMIFLNATFLPIALPEISKTLGINTTNLFWVVNVYFITSCALFLLGGRLVKRWGPLKIFRVGVSCYLLGSLIAFFSYNFALLLLGRVLCGMGSAMVSPASFSVIVHVYKESERGKKIGTLFGMSSVAMMIGPFLGGTLTQLLSWRSLFLLNIVIGIVAMVLTAGSKVAFHMHKERFDYLGFISFSSAVATLIYSITKFGVEGFSTQVIGGFIAACLSTLMMLLASKKAEHPYLDFKLFHRHAFLLAIGVMFFAQVILSITFFWPVYFLIEKVVGSTPIQVGSVISFATLGIFVFSPISGVYFDKRGFKRPIVLGWALLVVALAGFCYALMHPQKWTFMIFLTLFGIGVAFISTPTGTLAQQGVEKSVSGMVSGLFNTVRFFGSSIGIAVWGSLITHQHEKGFYGMLDNQLAAKLPAFKTLSKAKISGNFKESFNTLLSQVDLEKVSAIWNTAYQKSFFLVHVCLLSIAVMMLCFLVGFSKKNFINQFSK